MIRRSFLKAAPAALTITALPAAASSDTPILRLFHQHRDLIDRAREHVSTATGKAEDDELDRLYYHKANAIEAEMMALPCTCAADFAAKVIVDTACGGFLSDWETGEIWQEARKLTAA